MIPSQIPHALGRVSLSGIWDNVQDANCTDSDPAFPVRRNVFIRVYPTRERRLVKLH